MSAAGGISVAYVFVHLLPELAEGQEIIRKAVSGVFSALDHHAYLMALCGLIVFYGLERAAKEPHIARVVAPEEDAPDGKVFRLHVTSFSLYNVLIGYLLANNFRVIRSLAFFFIAMALHFVVTDFGLSRDFKETYRSVGPLDTFSCDRSGHGHRDFHQDSGRGDQCAGGCPGRRRHSQRLEGGVAGRVPKSVYSLPAGFSSVCGTTLDYC